MILYFFAKLIITLYLTKTNTEKKIIPESLKILKYPPLTL